VFALNVEKGCFLQTRTYHASFLDQLEEAMAPYLPPIRDLKDIQGFYIMTAGTWIHRPEIQWETLPSQLLFLVKAGKSFDSSDP
jgi:hypothetical protein